jgi:CheY-like chemotaxis protein
VIPAAELSAAQKVLVIDDDPSTLRVVDSTLKQRGYHVVTAASGAEGLRIARNQDFGLIICDLLMPDMDGFAVIAALEADPAHEHPPVVVFSGKDLTTTDRERLAGRTAGIIRKGDDGPAALRQWLDWAHTRPIPAGAPEPAVSAHSQGAST